MNHPVNPTIIPEETNSIINPEISEAEIYTSNIRGANTGSTKPPIVMTVSNLPSYFEAESMKRNETLPAYNIAIEKITTAL